MATSVTTRSMKSLSRDRLDTYPNLKFLMFENKTNICWMNASIALIVHNYTLRNYGRFSHDSEIYYVISIYNEATDIYNSCHPKKKEKATKILKDLQDHTFQYLKQFLKQKKNEADSAFCAVYNFIYQDQSGVKECFNISYILKKQCSNCGFKSTKAFSKPMITLSKVNIFDPKYPTSVYNCSCTTQQEMTLVYKELPPCLIFHFEGGAGCGTALPLSFYIENRQYNLTAIVILERKSKNIGHFFTLIRNAAANVWLECNDLNLDFGFFSKRKPEYKLKNVHLAAYEAFDDLGRINLEVAEEQDVENNAVDVVEISDDFELVEIRDSDSATSFTEEKDVNDCKDDFSEKEKENNINERVHAIARNAYKALLLHAIEMREKKDIEKKKSGGS